LGDIASPGVCAAAAGETVLEDGGGSCVCACFPGATVLGDTANPDVCAVAAGGVRTDPEGVGLDDNDGILFEFFSWQRVSLYFFLKYYPSGIVYNIGNPDLIRELDFFENYY